MELLAGRCYTMLLGNCSAATATQPAEPFVSWGMSNATQQPRCAPIICLAELQATSGSQLARAHCHREGMLPLLLVISKACFMLSAALHSRIQPWKIQQCFSVVSRVAGIACLTVSTALCSSRQLAAGQAGCSSRARC